MVTGATTTAAAVPGDIEIATTVTEDDHNISLIATARCEGCVSVH
jgi:hypothetical protein